MTSTYPETAQSISPRTNASRVPFAITDRSFIPRERYFDRDFFALENEKLWTRTWQMACRLEEIPNVGDYIEYTVAQYSILVVRTSSDTVKAFQNQCRHRGTQLAEGCGTFRGGQIVCPFHAWRWAIDGSPATPMYGHQGFEDRVMNPEDLRLVECQVGVWAGCVFINMDRNAEPLLDFLAPVPENLDPLRLGDMRVNWWKGVRLKANWKLALEAFMEGWHVRGTHTQLTGDAGDAFPNPHDFQVSYPNGHQSLAKDPNADTKGSIKNSMGLSDSSEADSAIAFLRMLNEQLNSHVLAKDIHVAESLRACPPGEFSKRFIDELYAWNAGAGIRLPDRDVISRWGSQWSIFPNFKFHPLYGNSIAYRSRPDSEDPGHCFFEMWSLTLQPEDSELQRATFDGEFALDDEDNWPLIARQDFVNIERQQRGLRMPGLPSARLAQRYEDGIANFHLTIDRHLAG